MPAFCKNLSKICVIFLFISLLGSCTGRKLDPSQIVSVTDYVDGVAIAKTMEGNFEYYYFVDTDLRLVEPGIRLGEISEFVDGYALAESKQPIQQNSTKKYIFNRKGEPVLSAEYNETLFLVTGGKAWRTGGRGMQFINLADMAILFDENLWGLSVTPSGTSLLKRTRSDKKADQNGNVNLMEYMLIDCTGRILIPWGRISYIGDFANGMAIASNSIRSGYRWHVDEVTLYGAPGYNYGMYGFINEQGNWIVPDQYYFAENFNDAGYGRISTSVPHFMERPEWKYIDRTGCILHGDEAETARRSFNQK